jgi:hypothetical protein
MGICNFGAPRKDIEFLKSLKATDIFIETGTFKGETAAWAAQIFSRVITIEGLEENYLESKRNLAHLNHVECFHGDSRDVLPQVLEQIGGKPALFWLDAHWMPGAFGKSAECPIFDELKYIRKTSPDHIILIDDARYFLAPPPQPHEASDWPTIGDVINFLNAGGAEPLYTVVQQDVVYSVPESMRKAARDYFQIKATEEMNAHYAKPHPLEKLARRLVGR